MSRPGALSFVLHTHMPYVEGFDRWPFGEEWLWEAIVTSYLPLLDLLEAGAPLTLSLTPVLCDQLEAPGWPERFDAFVRDVRRETHRRDAEALRARGEPEAAAAVERSLEDYERARERVAALGGDLLGALAPHAAWTSAATHAVLPLVATGAGVRLQVRTGVESHRRRFGDGWRGGFWLPECAHAPWLDPLLEEAGVHATCVDLTDVLDPATGPAPPLRSPAGPLLVPVDRPTVELVWSSGGYPSHPAYRDYHWRTEHDHNPYTTAGRPYDALRAVAAAREHARDFVARVGARAAGGGLVVCALDSELLGHWWYEGPVWLRTVLEEAAEAGLEVLALDDALERFRPADAPAGLPETTWGTPRDLSTWSGPRVADLAWRVRDAELRVVAAGAGADERAVRELLALQSSDWAFLVTRDLAAEYGRRRSERHRAALDAALAAPGAEGPRLRNLAPGASPRTLREP